MGEIFTSLVSLKFLNVLASATKFHYQKKKKNNFGHLGLKKLGVSFLELMKTKCFIQPTIYEMRGL